MVGNLNNSGLYKSDEKEERNINTPLRSDAFNLNEEEKMKKIAEENLKKSKGLSTGKNIN